MRQVWNGGERPGAVRLGLVRLGMAGVVGRGRALYVRVSIGTERLGDDGLVRV
jgi:hypothetical protein